nr:(2Fe-2S)-binding protein [Sinorhizobium meliloti]
MKLVRIEFAGQELELGDGENLAAALLGAGVTPFRYTPVSGAPRDPYCMMGACFECLVDIDGVTRQACMSEVHAGMVVRRPKVGQPDEV